MLLDQPGKIRAYKLVTAAGTGPYYSTINYEIGKKYSVESANTDPAEDCGEGIHVATLDYVMKEWKDGYRILIVEFTANDIAGIPQSGGGKFRLFRCKVIGEKNLDEIGLPFPEYKKPEAIAK